MAIFTLSTTSVQCFKEYSAQSTEVWVHLIPSRSDCISQTVCRAWERDYMHTIG